MGDFGKFLRKRAPFYIAGIAIMIIFVIPALTQKEFADTINDAATDMSAQERIVLEYILDYTGGDDSGINLRDAASDIITEDYPDDNVFAHRSTTLHVAVMPISIDVYRAIMDFESHNGQHYFDWEVNMDTGTIKGNNNISKDALDVVNFYD